MDIDRILLDALYRMIIRTKGRCLIIKPKKLLKYTPLSTKPVNCAIAGAFLETLRSKGLIDLWRESSHGKWYIIRDTSPLWKEAKKLVRT